MYRRARAFAFICFGLFLIPSFASAESLSPGDVVNADFTSLSSHVHSIDLSLNNETYGSGNAYDHDVTSNGCWAGFHCWDIENVASSYKTFCGDMTVSPSMSATPHLVSDYSGDIESIWGTYYDSLLDGQDDALEAAAVQLAIWEVLHETAGSYDIANGGFQLLAVTPNNGANLTNLTELTNTYLTSSNWTATTDLLMLTSEGYQPFFYPASVPEPTTMVLLISLFATGFLSRKMVRCSAE